MTAPALLPEFLALPLGRNGLPDILVLNYTYYQGSLQTIAEAFIVESDPTSTGYWAERICTNGHESQKWSRLYALERARERVVSQQRLEPLWQPKPVEFLPFENWDALAVQRELGFYPMLQAVANNSMAVSTALRDKPVAHEHKRSELHFNLK